MNSNYNFNADVNRDGVINGQDLTAAKKDLGASTLVSPVVSVNLDPASDPAADRTTPFSTVHFNGTVTPNATVTFVDNSSGGVTTTTANSSGPIHHRSARDRLEYVHGHHSGRLWTIDHGRDLAGRVLAVGDRANRARACVNKRQRSRPRVGPMHPRMRAGGGSSQPAGRPSFVRTSRRCSQCSEDGARTIGSGSSLCRSKARRARRCVQSVPGPMPRPRDPWSSSRSSQPRGQRADRLAERAGCRAPARHCGAGPARLERVRRGSLECSPSIPRDHASTTRSDPGSTHSGRASSSADPPGRRLAIPGTDVLADVAAEYPAVSSRRILFVEHCLCARWSSS